MTEGKISVRETWRSHWEERSGTCGRLWFCMQWSSLNVFEERTLNCWLYVGRIGGREGIRGNVSVFSTLCPVPGSLYCCCPCHVTGLSLAAVLYSSSSLISHPTPVFVQVFRICIPRLFLSSPSLFDTHHSEWMLKPVLR